MRVHGDIHIIRKESVEEKADYHDYIPDLRADFHNMCGYCGKHEMVSHRNMEPDHFVPDCIDHDRQCDYMNLVYSCFTCNRKKSGKWPTNDKNSPHNGKRGFVDPACEEFDLHLERDNAGKIAYKTDVGKYMLETAFKFNIRPTKEIWKASLIYRLLDRLHRISPRLSSEQKIEAFELQGEFNKLSAYLFESKE